MLKNRIEIILVFCFIYRVLVPALTVINFLKYAVITLPSPFHDQAIPMISFHSVPVY